MLKIKTIHKYTLKDLEKMEAFKLHLLTNVVKFNETYYLPDEKIPYPNYASQELGKFENSVVWEQEYTDYDEVYGGIEPLYTTITTNFILPDKTVETGIVAQMFIEDYPKFIEELEKNNYAVYHNEEYSPFKWLAWVKDNSIRLIHQDYRGIEAKTEFDIIVDKDWFLHFSQHLINSMKHYSEAELKQYNKYVKERYKKA